jgi:hypothetical protein
MPAREDGVHSLIEMTMRGNDPWAFALENHTYLGGTTLAGMAATLDRLQTWDNISESERIQVEVDDFERSACAYPVTRTGKIAGVLIISSTHPHFFMRPIACQAVIEYAQRLSEPYLFNHAMRSWLFAEAIGRIKGIDYDREVVAIGTILHDIGLTASVSGPNRFEVNGADAALSFIKGEGLSDRRAQLIWDLVALNSTPSLALHKEPEVAVGTMGIGLDYGGFGVEALPAGDVERILSAFPRLRMKQRFTETCCRLVTAKPETTHDNFLRDFGERFVPGYKAVSTVDLLMNAPFDE